MHDRVTVAAVDRRARSFGPLPVRAGDVLPPIAEVAHVDRPCRLAKDERAGDEQVGVGVRVERRVERPLAEGHVAGLPHEAAELRSGHRPLVHPEAVHSDAMYGPLFWIEVLRAHPELARGNPAHVLERWRAGRLCVGSERRSHLASV